MLPDKKIAIVIPARYHSKRLPGKPLHHIAGIPLLQRVWEIAQEVVKRYPSAYAVVSTEDDRIVDFCNALDIPCLKTSESCKSGTDRVRETMQLLDSPPDYVINLQGDNALCPYWFILDLIHRFEKTPEKAVYTPYIQLRWKELDAFRIHKKSTPFSGTFVVFDSSQRALWFSKKILPSIRNEASIRKSTNYAPVHRHIGLYAYERSLLADLKNVPHSPYEDLEGLEQLSWLANGIPIRLIKVDYKGRKGLSGIDSIEDIRRAEEIIRYNQKKSKG